LQKQDKFAVNLRRLIVTAVFLSIYLIVRQVSSFYIPLFGETGMRVGVDTIFSLMPAFLFGPVWGAISTGTGDVLGFMMRPMGAYLPLMTVIAISRGFLCGLLWLWLRNINPVKIRNVVLCVAGFLIAFGIVNRLMLSADGITPAFFYNLAGREVDTSGMYFISQWLVVRTAGVSDPAGMLSEMITTVTWGLVGAGLFALVLFAIDLLLSTMLKNDDRELSYAQEENAPYLEAEGCSEQVPEAEGCDEQATLARKKLPSRGINSIMPLLIAVLVSAWWQNSLNTILLRETIIPAWQLLPLVVVWLPRIISATVFAIIHSYGIAILLGVFKRLRLPFVR